MDDRFAALDRAHAHAAHFLGSLDSRPVWPRATMDEMTRALGGPLARAGLPAGQVVDELASAADPGLVAIPGGRFFGFVIGGALPAALAADWLTSVWDQNPGLYVGGPAASVVEEVARGWLVELLGLPAHPDE
jgi:glutamate/tyrosine decarboxylase-like PLP-dependent enzyme